MAEGGVEGAEEEGVAGAAAVEAVEVEAAERRSETACSGR